MQAVVSSLLAVVLSIHAVVGCFCHETRCAATCDSTEPAVAHHEGCCHDHGHPPAPAPSEAPCKCKLECHSTCIFLPVQKAQLDAPFAHVALDLPPAAPPATVWLKAVGTGELAWSGDQFAPHLRLHLAHQVLLI